MAMIAFSLQSLVGMPASRIKAIHYVDPEMRFDKRPISLCFNIRGNELISATPNGFGKPKFENALESIVWGEEMGFWCLAPLEAAVSECSTFAAHVASVAQTEGDNWYRIDIIFDNEVNLCVRFEDDEMTLVTAKAK